MPRSLLQPGWQISSFDTLALRTAQLFKHVLTFALIALGK